MAHTRVWVVTDPAGSVLAKDIDNRIRELRVDIDERMNEICVNWGAEPGPIDLQAQFKGNVVGKRIVIPWTNFRSSTTGKESVIEAGRVFAFTDTSLMVAGIILPNGCTITRVEVLIDKGDAASTEFDFYTRSFAAGAGRPGSATAQVSQAHVTNAAAGVVVMDSGVLNVGVDDTHLYYIAVDGIGPNGNSYDLFGARVTYDTPDCRRTI